MNPVLIDIFLSRHLSRLQNGTTDYDVSFFWRGINCQAGIGQAL